MCCYCAMGDWAFRHDPPWDYKEHIPYIPMPLTPPSQPYKEWDMRKLQEYYDLLRKVKEMEDKLGCPCEPNKADYLKIISERLEFMKKRNEYGSGC